MFPINVWFAYTAACVLLELAPALTTYWPLAVVSARAKLQRPYLAWRQARAFCFTSLPLH